MELQKGLELVLITEDIVEQLRLGQEGQLWDSHESYLRQPPRTMVTHLVEMKAAGATVNVLSEGIAAFSGPVPWMWIWLDAVRLSPSLMEGEDKRNCFVCGMSYIPSYQQR